MAKEKLIQINVRTAREIARVLDRSEELLCNGCAGELHDESCPARQAYQLRNYLTQRINNPNKNYGV